MDWSRRFLPVNESLRMEGAKRDSSFDRAVARVEPLDLAQVFRALHDRMGGRKVQFTMSPTVSRFARNAEAFGNAPDPEDGRQLELPDEYLTSLFSERGTARSHRTLAQHAQTAHAQHAHTARSHRKLRRPTRSHRTLTRHAHDARGHAHMATSASMCGSFASPTFVHG